MRQYDSCSSWLPDFPFLSVDDPITALACCDNGRAPSVSQLYAATRRDVTAQMLKLRGKWDAMLEIPLTDEEWGQAQGHVRTTVSNYRHKIIQFKIFHQIYHTPVKLARLYPGRSAECPKCGHHEATFVHLLWNCPVVHELWSEVNAVACEVIGVQIALDPRIWLLGLPPKMTHKKLKLLFLMAATTKHCIATRWLAQRAPNIYMWWAMLLKHHELHTEYQSIVNPRCTPRDLWAPLLVYWEELNAAQPADTVGNALIGGGDGSEGGSDSSGSEFGFNDL